MKARMANPAMVLPDTMRALMALAKSAAHEDVPTLTRHLVRIRASQINGCSVCLDMHAAEAKQDGETDQRLFAVAAWRETPYFTEAERAVLALTEAATRLSDRTDPVPADIWDEAARHYQEPALAALIVEIASINVWNRLNVTTRQIAGEWSAA